MKKKDFEKIYTDTEQTQDYSKTDYGERGLGYIRSGASGDAVRSVADTRQEKAKTPEYSQYYDDGINKKLNAYADLYDSVNAPFSYENGKAQLNTRQKQLEELVQGLQDYKQFEYNPETDPVYAALAKQYTKNGQRAMQDTTAALAARTGGIASSYAASAGNQAYANYMSELSGKIPELSELAYQMYNDEYNRKLTQANLVNNLYQSDLSRYMDERNFAYGQHTDNRSFAYSQLQDMISGERYNNEWDYALSRDAIADERYANEWDYALSRDAIADERYANEWDYALSRDAIADERYANEWDYALSRDAIADKRYADETAYNRAQDQKAWDFSERELASSIARTASSESSKSPMYDDVYKRVLTLGQYGTDAPDMGDSWSPRKIAEYLLNAADQGVITDKEADEIFAAAGYNSDDLTSTNAIMRWIDRNLFN